MGIVGGYLCVVFGGWAMLLVVGAWGELREFQLKYAEVQLDKAMLKLSLIRRGELLMQLAGGTLTKEKELVAAQNKAAGLEVRLYNERAQAAADLERERDRRIKAERELGAFISCEENPYSMMCLDKMLERIELSVELVVKEMGVRMGPLSKELELGARYVLAGYDFRMLERFIRMEGPVWDHMAYEIGAFIGKEILARLKEGKAFFNLKEQVAGVCASYRTHTEDVEVMRLMFESMAEQEKNRRG